MGELLVDLQDPANHPRPQPASVELITTHISWVLRGDRSVWKLKRPVTLPFLDYGSLGARAAACRAEVAVNAPLGGPVYRGVAAVVRGSDGVHRLVERPEPGAEVVDHAVHMRRLDDATSFEQLLGEDRLDPAQLDALAERLVRFHAHAARADGRGTPACLRALFASEAASCRDFRGDPLPVACCDAVAAYLDAWPVAHADELSARVAAGRCREGHGDLRLEHVYLVDGRPLVIDGVEFDRDLRSGDVACDLAFLVMDLARIGRGDLGERFLARYAMLADDYGLFAVLPPYRCYRAWVRAKVAAIRARDAAAGVEQRAAKAREAAAYAELARAAIPSGSHRPTLWICSGLPGSGKSTLADHLRTTRGAVPVASDRVRKAIAGIPAEAPGPAALYASSMTRRTYRGLGERCARILDSGRDAVADATCPTPEQRRRLIDLAGKRGAAVRVLHCIAPDDELRRRLGERTHDPSDADAGVLAQFRRDYRPPTVAEGAPVTRVDTSAPRSTWP